MCSWLYVVMELKTPHDKIIFLRVKNRLKHNKRRRKFEKAGDQN